MKRQKKDKYLITCAFPYANGPIHLGHLLEHIQADIFVRFLRMQLHTVFFICSDDTHGTAIMLKSKQEKITPENLILKVFKEHKKIFLKFSIIHDKYSSTNTNIHKQLCEKIYINLKKKNVFFKKNIFQLYDHKLKTFLSDRFVKGTCPCCFSIDQYGDNCEKCGAIYAASDLIDAKSVLSNSSVSLKKTLHIFLNLPMFENFLKNWINLDIFQPEIFNKIQEWLIRGLKPWDISRDQPYFGFLIPNYFNKYFYVWFDASIGYLSCFQELCKKKKNIVFSEFWKLNSSTKLYHFIGKDIVNFHSLFWPSILDSLEYRKPTKIVVHGHITIQGKKLSKSTGVLITAKKCLKFFDSESVRYYFATKLNNNVQDIEINLKDFVYKVNADLVNRVVNLASRTSSFLKKFFFNTLSKKFIKSDIYLIFLDAIPIIKKLYYNHQFSLVTKKIMHLADLANQYITNEKPWTLVKENNFEKIHNIVSMGLNLFRILMIFLKPITPILARKTEKFLKISLDWNTCHVPLLNHQIENFFELHKRIDIKILKKFFKDYKI
ncbi:Methionine--tRNA ligase [Buchnera aphidicola (Tuberolachnus salignus)]|uniref:Methionine--tRNA ligase n=1 Tax=Buchnera aphidicola subsp. Tuberolachnus salignus TaxID=98804 RepID=A0A170PBJ6_BUCTT|nr:methionine--tRNA ligase [Buchnera aphidicola]CUR53059.1 Methionine--tRNA ligase [Buchnera aphidicola (Tuberolachnus salignus)]